MKVLIVDDVPSNLRLLRAQLEAAGCSVTEAVDGVQALAVLDAFEIDVVVSDTLMPNMDGYRLCHEVRSKDQFRNLPFVMYTATYTSPADQKLCFDLGADEYLRKPASIDEILRSIESAKSATHRVPTVAINWQEMLKNYSEQLVSRLDEKNVLLAATAEQVRLQVTALETADNAIIITNRLGVIEWVNPAFTAQTGYSPQEAIGQTPRILKSGKQNASFYREFWKTIAGGKTWRGEFTNCRKDGELYYDEHTVTPVFAADGTITHFVGIMHDVTDRKRVEEEIRSTHAQLNHLLANSPAVIYALKIRGEEIIPHIVSENVTELLGFEVFEAMGYDWWAGQLHPDDRDRALASLSETISRGSSTTEYRLQHKDGSYRNVEDKRRLTLNAAGKPEEIVGVWSDITERVEMGAALRQSEERLKLAMGASNVGQWDWDTETDAVYFSPEWKRQLGYEDDEIANEFSEWKARLHPDDEEHTMTALEEFRADRRNGYNVEFRLRHKDGTYRWIHTKANYGSDQGSNQSHIYGCHVDITERKAAEESLRTTNEQLEARVAERTSALAQTNDDLIAAKLEADRANAAKSEFLSGMSHELRTPLNAILGFAQLLEMESHTDKQRDSIDHILGGGRHLLDLINKILELSRIESGKVEMSIEPVSVSEIVKETILLVHQMAKGAGVRLIDGTIGSETFVLADRLRLRQVLMNLLSNAIKYNVRDGSATVSTSSAGGQAVIEVQDTGVGVPRELVARLFVPFDRLGAASRKVEGTGLGLSISRKFCESMGGTIEYRASDVGRGSVFAVVLPSVESVSVASGRQAAGAGSDALTLAGPCTIVYIEDNPANLELVQTILSNYPEIRLHLATCGRDGLELAMRYKPDVILLDLNLPDISGTEVMEKIMCEPALQNTPVIVVSADATESQIRKLNKMGAHAYLTKPLVISELLHKLSQVFARKEPIHRL